MLLNCGVGEDFWESLGLQEDPTSPKGNLSWIFIGRTDAEAEIPILWPPDVKSWFIWKDPNVGKDWGQEEKGTTEDEMVGWHHRFNRDEVGWTPWVGDRQGGLVCCGSWGRKESDTTERLNWTELNITLKPSPPSRSHTQTSPPKDFSSPLCLFLFIFPQLLLICPRLRTTQY